MEGIETESQKIKKYMLDTFTSDVFANFSNVKISPRDLSNHESSRFSPMPGKWDMAQLSPQYRKRIQKEI